MTNVYDIFRSVQNKRKTCYDNRSAAFILEGKISQNIYHKRLNKDIKAALVFNDKEGPDEVSVFTLIEDDLQKADYFIFDNVNYLVYENVKQTDQDMNHKKQKAVECNVTFNVNGSSYNAFFVSTMRRRNSPSFQGRQGILPDEAPLMIVPKTLGIQIGTSFTIEGKPWKVIDYDDITNSGISYLYIERSYQKKSEIAQEPEEKIFIGEGETFEQSAAQEFSLKPMVEYTFSTEDGHFASTPRVQVIKRTLKSVAFKVPFGIEEVTITTKDENSGEIAKTYQVVL